MKFKDTKIGIVPSHWEVRPIKEITEIVTDYVANGSFASLAENVTYKDEEDVAVLIRLVDYNNDFQGKFVFIDEHAYQFLGKSKLFGGEIIISNVGANVGTVFRCPQLAYKMSLAPNSVMVRFKGNDDFYFHWLRGFNGQQMLKSIVTGSAQPKFNKTNFKEMLAPVPPIGEQNKIASILNTIDEKIEINKKINNNLAEQSQAIFAEFMCKYPYVLSPLGDMAEIIDCLHSKKPKAVNGTTYQLLQLNNITDSGFLDLSSKYYISKSDYENWTRKCEIVEGDCVITNVGRIGAVSQAPNGTHAAMGRNMTCIRLRNDKPFYSYLITALLSPHIRREIMKNTDEGTIMGALNVKNIPLLLVPMFALPTMNALEDLLSPIRKAIEQNYLSNQMLSLLRDSLLPRLMSGELDVSNIEI